MDRGILCELFAVILLGHFNKTFEVLERRVQVYLLWVREFDLGEEQLEGTFAVHRHGLFFQFRQRQICLENSHLQAVNDLFAIFLTRLIFLCHKVENLIVDGWQ